MSAQDITTARLRPESAPLGRRYRLALSRRAGAVAVPYGYTALTASTFGVLIATHGPPTSGCAALYLTGAVLGFTAAALLGTEQPQDDGAGTRAAPGPLAGLASGAAAAAALGVVAVLAHAIGGAIAFAAASFAATALYLGVGALAAAHFDHRGQEGTRSH